MFLRALFAVLRYVRCTCVCVCMRCVRFVCDADDAERGSPVALGPIGVPTCGRRLHPPPPTAPRT